MPTNTDKRIAELQKQVNDLEHALYDLAMDYAEELHGHDGPVSWDDTQGWLLIIPNRDGELSGKYWTRRAPTEEAVRAG
jgi:hypothetical protein